MFKPSKNLVTDLTHVLSIASFCDAYAVQIQIRCRITHRLTWV